MKNSGYIMGLWQLVLIDIERTLNLDIKLFLSNKIYFVHWCVQEFIHRCATDLKYFIKRRIHVFPCDQ